MDGIQAAPIARPSRGGLPSESSLAPGQVIHARVSRVDGDSAQLRWGEHSVTARTRTPLAVGQQVSLAVERSAAGQILLRMVDDARGGPADGAAPLQSPRPAAEPTGAATTPGAPAPVATPLSAQPGAAPGALDPASGDPLAVILAPPTARPSAPADRSAPLGPAEVFDVPVPGAAPEAARVSERGGDAAREQPWTLAAGADPAGRPPAAAAPLLSLLARAALPAYGQFARPRIRPTLSPGRPGAGEMAGAPGEMASAREAGRVVGDVATPGPSLLPMDLLEPDAAGVADSPTARLLAELSERDPHLEGSGARSLLRQLTQAGAASDLRPLILLTRLGLPTSPRLLELARQLVDGAIDPRQSWSEALTRLVELARQLGDDPAAGPLRDALTPWTPPLDGDTAALADWLRGAVEDVGTPLEAKLAQIADPRSGAPDLGQDARIRLAMLQHALDGSPRDRSQLGQAIERLEAAIEAEQLLNASGGEKGEVRYFAVTLPAATPLQQGAVELSVRARPEDESSGAQAGPDIVRLRLTLPRLGDLRINLAVDRPHIACHFAAESPFAAALLDAGAAELAQGLERLGYQDPAVAAAERASSGSEIAPLVPLLGGSWPRRVDMSA